jgi:hypothetical protein
MPRPATIGPAVFERVNALVAEGKTRTEAFAQVGKERKSRPGTVAANYYRVARAQGGGRRSGRRTTSKPRTSTANVATRTAAARSQQTVSGGDGDLRQIAQQIAALTQELVRQVEERDAKLRALVG